MLTLLLAVSFRALAATSEAESPVFAVDLTGSKGIFSGAASAESGLFAVDLRGITGPSDLLRSGVSDIFAVNLRGLRGGLAVSGTVFDVSAGAALAGATVQIGTASSQSGPAGQYVMPGLSAGEPLFSVSKAGYQSLSGTLAVPSGATLRRDFRLYPSASSGSAPRVVSLACKYPGFLTFLEGVSFLVTFTAQVDWAGHPPGKVQFLTPRGSFDVATSGSTASRQFNMGTDFGPGGRLRVVAVSGDGARSAETTADFVVAPPPVQGMSGLLGVSDRGDHFAYNTSAGLNIEFIKQGVEAGVIPEGLPLFGQAPFRLDWFPEVDSEIGSDGRAQFFLKWKNLQAGKVKQLEAGRKQNLKKLIALLEGAAERGKVDQRRLPKVSVAGAEIALYPILEGALKFNVASGRWDWGDLGVGIAGHVEASRSGPFIIFVGPVPVPVYAKASVELAADARGQAFALDPVTLGLHVDIDPYVRGSLGAGIDEVLAVEGWIGGGAEMDVQWPQTRTFDAKIYLNGGMTVYALLFHWENELLRWEWPKKSGAGARMATSASFDANVERTWPSALQPLAASALPQPVGRDYLHAANYGSFLGAARPALKASATDGGILKALTHALQTQIFPYSEAACASSGTNFMLVWLYDKPERTLNNRTMLVASKFDGEAWTEPVPVDDDGTADFHPQLLVFGDSSALAAWESEKTVLPDTATFDDMKANLEIKAAFFNPATPQWQPARQFTTNSFLDRSPKIAGTAKDNVLLVWAANPAKDTTGSATNANQLWFTRWNGSGWSAPQTFATVADPLLKYDLAYDGTNAHLVMSLDSDGDLQTIGDHELFQLAYLNQSWGALERLTTDAVADDNPQLAVDPGGRFVLVWLRRNEISSVVDFVFAEREIVRQEPEYSSNLADFTLGGAADGRLALVWTEPSQYSSDLRIMSYDPVFRLWGQPKQLTFDTETECGTTLGFFGMDTLVAAYDRT
ncbi:MAG: carboxypeptidase regulatory-like domain-containing protein [Chloroflexi bacterium]|nr:carboxypeptidase regulatory-like domain-containing protein [Chloroflexota bacterium]